MQKSLLSTFCILGIFLPFFSDAAESYIGNGLGLDFYSVIDDGSYTLRSEMVQSAMKTTPTLGDFGRGCPGINMIENEMTSTDVLDYGVLSNLLKKNGYTSVSTEVYQELALCLNQKYNDLITEKEGEIEKIQKLSLGIYTDGNTKNSDYDIMTDIDKINSVLFSETLKYSGVTNTSAASLSDTLAGKKSTPFTLSYNLSTSGATASGSENPTLSGSTSISDVIGEICTTNTSTVPIDAIMDAGFLAELDQTLRGKVTSSPSGYSNAGITASRNQSQSGSVALPTRQNDFYHAGSSCDGMFCIDARFIGGTQKLLGNSKSISIESLIEKHHTLLDPIAASNLACQRMTNQIGEAPFDKVKWSKTFSGLKVYYNSRPQQTKRLSSETTEKSEAEALLKIQRCALSSVGLPSDPALSNTPTVLVISQNTALTTENSRNRIFSTTPSNMDDPAIGASCMDLYMDEGRKTYYDSFTEDITEISSFSRSIVQELTNIILTATVMDKKPTGC